jgi:ABC-type transport system involved in Fe-S cluster assembly fused permease/ATPase subunit
MADTWFVLTITRMVRVRLFEHLHSLSLQFHLERKTGESKKKKKKKK